MISDCLRNLNDHACSTSNLSCGDRRQPRQLERTSSFGKGRLIGYSNLAKECFPRREPPAPYSGYREPAPGTQAFVSGS